MVFCFTFSLVLYLRHLRHLRTDSRNTSRLEKKSGFSSTGSSRDKHPFKPFAGCPMFLLDFFSLNVYVPSTFWRHLTMTAAVGNC